MHEQENEYPVRPSRRLRGEGARQSDEEFEEEWESEAQPRRRRRASGDVYEDERSQGSRVLAVVVAGCIGGVFAFLVNVVITFINSPLFQRQLQEGKNVSSSTAFAIFGIVCLNFCITLVIYAIVGFVVGKLTVRRVTAFWAGAIAGAIVYGASFLTAYIPGYPGTQASAGRVAPATDASGILIAIGISVLFLLITAIIGGLLSLLGAWLATRAHPYYRREAAE